MNLKDKPWQPKINYVQGKGYKKINYKKSELAVHFTHTPLPSPMIEPFLLFLLQTYKKNTICSLTFYFTKSVPDRVKIVILQNVKGILHWRQKGIKQKKWTALPFCKIVLKRKRKNKILLVNFIISNPVITVHLLNKYELQAPSCSLIVVASLALMCWSDWV